MDIAVGKAKNKKLSNPREKNISKKLSFFPKVTPIENISNVVHIV